MDLHLTGKRAIVTGASRGIGLAVASALAAEGARVALVARDRTALAGAAERVGGAVAVVADTADDASVRAMVDEVVAGFGGVDVLVNVAAKPAGGPVPSGVGVAHPGGTVTERSPGRFAGLAATEGGTPADVEARLGAATSIGRLVTAGEVADVVAFRCLPRKRRRGRDRGRGRPARADPLLRVIRSGRHRPAGSPRPAGVSGCGSYERVSAAT